MTEDERTTDENDPLGVPATSAPAVPPAGAEPEPLDTSASDADPGEGEDEEPLEASRLSPYAVAAFATSLLALFQAPQQLFTAQGLAPAQFLRYVLPTLAVPLGAAVVGLWLALRSDEEIFVSDGRLGGVGFSTAAKVISVGVLLLCVAAVVLVLFFSEQPQQQMQFG